MSEKFNKNGFIDIEIKPLINRKGANGCIVSDKITKGGWKVGYMYRETPDEGVPDSGWRFLKGDEDDEFMDNPENSHIFALNTVCNYDPDIIPYLDSAYGVCFIRVSENSFERDDGSKPIFFRKQNDR